MARVIKFRAWDKTGHSMHDNEFAKTCITSLTEGGNKEEWEVMQFTGLTDRNGKEIYEGDLLKNGPGAALGEVKFKDGVFVVGNYGCELWRYSGDTKEIIGNIYENPDLLLA